MKRLLMLLIILISLFAMPVRADDISNADFYGVVTITNNSTSASSVSVDCSINSTALIDAGFIGSGAANLTMRNTSGSAVAFMPGYNGAYWYMYVPSMTENEILSYLLYNNSSGGKYAIFPGAAGANVTDTAALEPGNNFAANITCLSPSGTYQTLLGKPGSWEIFRDSVNPNTVAVSINSTSSISYLAGDNADLDVFGVNWRGQTFTVATSQVFNQVRMYCRRTGNPGNLTISIYNTAAGVPTGSPLITVTGSANGFNLANAYQGLNFKTMFVLVPGTYAWVASCPAGDAANKLTLRRNTAGAFAGGQVTSSDSGTTWAADAAIDLLFYVDGTISAVGTANSVEHLYGATMDTANLKLYVDGALQATTALGAATAPDNANAWKIAPVYFTSVNMTVSGVQKAHWEWQYAATLTDTISGITMNPNYRTTSSDPDVSAELTSWLPVSESKAPGYTLDNPPNFISDNITAGSTFSTSVNGTAKNFPLKGVIESVSVGGQTPSQLAFLLIFLFLSSAGGVLIVWFCKTYNAVRMEGIILVVFLIICYGLGVSLGVIDKWMLYGWCMVSPGLLYIGNDRGG